MQIWPAIDIRGGKCVRLKQGDYTQETVYGSNPADMAHRFVADGARGLHIVDLDGARNGSSANLDAVTAIVNEISIPCQLGGGIRDQQTISQYLDLGITRLVIGTKALTDQQWLSEMSEKHPGQLLVAIDARDGRVTTEGWQKTSEVSATDLARQIAACPIAGIIYTDISKDGMMSGPNFDAIGEMAQAVDLPLICAGGVTTVDDVVQLTQLGLSGCVIGRSLYEGRLTVQDAIRAAGVQTLSP